MSHPLVLCYHAASERWPHILSLPPTRIESQVRRLIAMRYRPVGVADAISRQGRLLHVTFDDAFHSVDNVLPALERMNVPVTIFACSGYAAEGRPLDVPELRGEVERFPDELRTMNWDRLRALSECGIEIGAHTVSHPHLPELGDSELQTELRDCRTQIEDELRKPCRFVAYPYGEADDRVCAAAKLIGFDAGFLFTTEGDPSDLFRFPRVGLYPRDEGARFLLKTARSIHRPLLRLRQMSRLGQELML